MSAGLEAALKLLGQLGGQEDTEHYLALYESLLVECWFTFDAADSSDLFSIGERLRTHYELHGHSKKQLKHEVADELCRPQEVSQRDYALSELKQYFISA